MIDVFNIPSNTQSTFTFYATGNWQTWNKPRGAKMIEIFCLGGGGGGGHPTVGAVASSGGGGGSGGIVRGLIPAFLLPDTLYIQVGKGGAGPSTSATVGGTGGITYIGIQPSTSEQTLICKSSTAGATGGAVLSAGGAAATISVVSLSAFANLGLFTAIAGVIGSIGGGNTGTNGTSQSALGTNLTTGGGGGGGKSATLFGTGSSITSASVILTSTVNGGVTAGQNGDSGYGILQPFCSTGGAGGAGGAVGTSSTGGKGGDGWYGSGGGGAGAGNFATKAGNGGDGLVIITVIS